MTPSPWKPVSLATCGETGMGWFTQNIKPEADFSGFDVDGIRRMER
jgi:hypothetical protein